MLSCLSLSFHPVHGLDEFCAGVRSGVGEYHEPYPVALAPQDVRSIGNVRLDRLQENSVKCLLRYAVFLCARLRVTADRDISELRDAAVKMVHPRRGYLRTLPRASLKRATDE